MSQLAKVESDQQAMVPADNVSPMFAMIERAARDPSVDIDKLERLMQMKERADHQSARAEFDAAMAEMQPELPAIGERGKAMVNKEVRYTYAKWEDINAAIKPVLTGHGFALTFRTDFANGIKVTGVLSHRSGHREETSIQLPADASGGKNAVQAVASSVSYGKRYTAGALLNLTSHGEDDDAFMAAGAVDPLADWLQAVEACVDDKELAGRKREMVNAFGGVNKVPAKLRTACTAKAESLKAGK